VYPPGPASIGHEQRYTLLKQYLEQKNALALEARKEDFLGSLLVAHNKFFWPHLGFDTFLEVLNCIKNFPEMKLSKIFPRSVCLFGRSKIWHTDPENI
jgi:hypothetical protein